MIFVVTKASDWDYKDQINIDTLEELMKFIETHGSIIVSPKDPLWLNNKDEGLPRIEIYDAWRE